MRNAKLTLQPLRASPKSSRQYRQSNICESTLPIIRSFNQKHLNLLNTFCNKKRINSKNDSQNQNYLSLSSKDTQKIQYINSTRKDVSQNTISENAEIQDVFGKTYAYGNAFRKRKVTNSLRKKSQNKIQNIQQLNVTSYCQKILQKNKGQFKSQNKYRTISKQKENNQIILIKISIPKMNEKLAKVHKSATVHLSNTLDAQIQRKTYNIFPLKDVRKNSISPWQLNQELLF